MNVRIYRKYKLNAFMTADLTSLTFSNYLAVLAQAANAYRGEYNERPSTTVVVDALLQAEKAAKQQRLTYPFASLLGQWRLCFATGTRKVRKRGGIILGKGFYWPKFTPAFIAFSAATPITEEIPAKGEINNQIQLGPGLLKLTGPAQYLGKKNLLAFDFTHMQVSLFNRVVYSGQIRGKAQTGNFYNQSIAKLPFFAFFAVAEDLIAARGRGGGLALWIREK
ncbi:hypothetical protein ACF3DV_23995 [Chlorogloeopsis fritschii PCC 9212]|uniref:Plastid lipid-associated protein/fibrillin conserved domain-containing protein n=2 Tax=Chlorogloeopsis fritschii TaxID=1124 RepID=A0A433NPZ8_CHLFR|nr:hypothetical protein PCC6912_06980 [Chlorogloeopsis fritschii PCC 6912]